MYISLLCMCRDVYSVVCVCVCYIPFILGVILVDAQAGVTQEEGCRGFIIHLSTSSYQVRSRERGKTVLGSSYIAKNTDNQ